MQSQKLPNQSQDGFPFAIRNIISTNAHQRQMQRFFRDFDHLAAVFDGLDSADDRLERWLIRFAPIDTIWLNGFQYLQKRPTRTEID